MASNWQFSSSGWRSPTNPWFRVGTVEVTTTVLVTAIGVASMFIWAADSTLFSHFYFSTTLVRDGELWRLVTWPLINAPSFLSAYTVAIFFFIGRQIESLVGRNRFLWFLAAMVIIPSALISAFSALATDNLNAGEAGLALLTTGTFAALVAHQPFARWFFNIQFWVIGCVFLGVEVLQLLGLRAYGQLLFTLMVVATSLTIMRSWGFAEDAKFIPKLASFGSPSPRTPKAKIARSRGPRKGGNNVTTGPWTASESSRWADQAQLDALLDKVGERGLDGLSAAERKQLDDLSRKMRGSS